MNEEDDHGQIIHWQFSWVSMGPLELDNLPTEGTCPQPTFVPLTDWQEVASFGVDSGKMSLMDKNMMETYIGLTGDQRLVIEVSQDPFSRRMGYQGVLPGGFFSKFLLSFSLYRSLSQMKFVACVQDGGYCVYVRKYENTVVQLKVREGRTENKEEEEEDEDI